MVHESPNTQSTNVVILYFAVRALYQHVKKFSFSGILVIAFTNRTNNLNVTKERLNIEKWNVDTKT